MTKTTAECAEPKASLRQRAEARFLENTPAISQPLSSMETEQLLHELQVHQIQLEMQNEELRRSQAELDSARADYFDLYDLAPLGYLTISDKGLVQKANLYASTMLGVVRNFLLNKPLSRFIFPEDQDVYFQSHKRLIENGELQNCALRLKRVDGSPLWVLLKASLAGNGDVWITFIDETERKQQEAASKNDLEYTENIVETVREPLLVLSSDLKILSANGSFYATFRVTPEETIGKYIYDLGNRQWDIPKLRLLLETILPTNTAFNDYEVDHIFQSIGHKTILLNARQIFRKRVGSHIILLAMEDITERKQKTVALDERTKELSCLYSIISLCTLPDIKQNELFTKAVMRIPPAWSFPEIAEASIETDGDSFQTDRFRETPWMLVSDITVNGTSIGQLKVCYLEERRASDEGVFLIQERYLLNGIAEKLGQKIERIRGGIELRKSEERHRTILHTALDGFWLVDMQGRLVEVNEAYCQMSGYSRQELLSMSISDFEASETVKETIAHIQKIKELGDVRFESRHRRKDGTSFDIEVSVQYQSFEGGHFVVFIKDITEKKSVMEQLIHSQKMESIGQLAGGLAHDLNNILTVVNGFASLAQFGMEKDQKAFKYLDEITRASSRAASLTRSLLMYSRKQEMNQQKQNLNLLIETVGSFINRIIHDNIRFTLSLQDNPLGVYVDTVQIEQVLLNLATNARDAMPNGGVFKIETKTGCIDEQFIAIHGYGTIGRYAIIAVSDTGTGMDAQTKLKVFDPFFTTKEAGKGTGLGLAMVMGIIRQHGGFVDLQSESGAGSTFELYLPLVDAGAIAAETTERSPQMEQGAGTILIAEDDADTLSSLEQFLTRSGYTVITAVDGQDAVEKFANHTDKIDLIISDVVMPRKSGKASSDEIRQMSESVKFIFVSGHASDVIQREGGLGTDVEIMEKPVLPYELLRKIRYVLDT